MKPTGTSSKARKPSQERDWEYRIVLERDHNGRLRLTTENPSDAHRELALDTSRAIRDLAGTEAQLSPASAERVVAEFSFPRGMKGVDVSGLLGRVLRSGSEQAIVDEATNASIRIAWAKPNDNTLDHSTGDVLPDCGEMSPKRTHEKPDPGLGEKFRPSQLTETLEQFAARLVPTISDADVSRLDGIIAEAQINPPANKREFVDQVNRLLDVFRLRIQLSDGSLVRLLFNAHATPGGTIQLNGPRGKRPSGTRGGFRTAAFRVVRTDPPGPP